MAATVTPNPPASPPPPAGPSQQATYAKYVDAQLGRTSDQLRLIEGSAEAVVLVLLVIGYVGLGVLADHWLIDGGLGTLGRSIAWLGLFAGAGIYFWLRILPWMVNRINPLYAAATIERTQPAIKNSLINFLFLRRTPPPPGVMHAIEQRAAADLSTAPVDAAIDRTRLWRGVGVLLALTALACGYKLFSPKDPIRSVGRIMLPWANIAPPTRVAISDVSPGDAVAYVGDELNVKAKVTGVGATEAVKAIFSTRSGEAVERPVVMKKGEAGNEYSVLLPDEPGGLTGDVHYYLAAGDVRTQAYHVSVRPAPTIVVTSVELKYPAYTKYPPETRRSGDFDAIEGTEVTLHGEANEEIAGRSALADFGCDGVSPYLRLDSTGKTAVGKFVLSSSPDAKHENYLLQFTNAEGRKNPKPVRHRIGVLRDLPPAIAFAAPAKDVQIPANGAVLLHLKAEDQDFGLASVELSMVTNGNRSLLKPAEKVLLSAPTDGPFEHRFTFVPAAYDLKAGDVVTYTATAKDVKSPDPNVVATEGYRIEIISPAANPMPEQVANATPPPSDQIKRDGPPADNEPNRGKPQDGPPPSPPKKNEGEKPQDGPPATPREPQDGPDDGMNKPQEQVASNEPPQTAGDKLDKLAELLNVKKEADEATRPNEPPQNDEPTEQGPKKEDKSGSVGGDQDGKKESGTNGQEAKDNQKAEEGKGGGKSGAQGKMLGEKESGEGGEGEKANETRAGEGGQKMKPKGAGENGGEGESETPNPKPNGAGPKEDKPNGAAPKAPEENINGQRPKNPRDKGEPGQNNPGGAKPQEPKSPEEQEKPEGMAEKPQFPPPMGDQAKPDQSGGAGDPMEQKGDKPSDGGGQSGNAQQPNDTQKPGAESRPPQAGQEKPAKESSAQEQPGSGKQTGDKSGMPPQNDGAGEGENQPMGGGQSPMGEGQQKSNQNGVSQPGEGSTKKASGGSSKPSAGDGHGQQPGSSPPNRDTDHGKPNAQPGDSGSAPPASKPNKGGEPKNNPPGQGDDVDPNARSSEEEPGAGDPMAKPQDRTNAEQKGMHRPNPDPMNPPEEPSRETNQTGGRGDGGQSKPAPEQRGGQRSEEERPDARGGSPSNPKGAGGDASPGQGDAGSADPNAPPESTNDKRKSEEKPSQEGKREDKRDEPNTSSISQKESSGDKRKNQSGDRSGGGGEGGGEQANQAGTGGAGKNTSSNEGSGQSPEAGDGAASNRGGDSRPSDTPTGSAGEEKGNGSSSRENPNGTQAGSNDPKAPPANRKANDKGEQPQQQGAGTGGNAPANRDRQQPPRAEQPSANGTPTGGGGSRAKGTEADGYEDGSQDPGGDEANREYTEKALDLVLQKLKDQLGNEKVDPELLKRSGFRSREELEAWVNQWEKLRQDAKQSGELGAAAKRTLDERMRGLGLTRPTSGIQSRRTAGDEVRKLRETNRVAPPAAYSEAADAYKTGINKKLPPTTVE